MGICGQRLWREPTARGLCAGGGVASGVGGGARLGSCWAPNGSSKAAQMPVFCGG